MMKVRGFIGLGLAALALGLLGLQGYEWLRYGFTAPVSAATLLASIGIPEFTQWIVAPTDWLGLHKFFHFAPAWTLLLPLGFVLWMSGL